MKIRYSEYFKNDRTLIPSIQRDYVQGADVNRAKRKDFLTAIFDALLPDAPRPLTIDFIYGISRKQTREFLPIDGQQRLTTLIFLGWLLAQRGLDRDESQKINFDLLSYNTRTSSEEFCHKLLSYRLPAGIGTISEHIRKEPLWFAETWSNDATVSNVLQLLDAADAMLQSPEYKPYVAEMAQRFLSDACPIIFEQLDMGDYGLNEDLYIKMNARGKYLSDFEILKADLYDLFKDKFKNEVYEYGLVPVSGASGQTPVYQKYTIPEYFSYAIEHQWTDLFWDYAYKKWDALPEKEKSNAAYPVTDDLFMRFFLNFTELTFAEQTDIEAEAKRLSASGTKVDNAEVFAGKTGEFLKENIRKVYSQKKNIVALFRALDLWSTIGHTSGGASGTKENIETFFRELFTNTFNPDFEGINLFTDKSVNLFERIITEDEKDQPRRFLMRGLTRALLHYFTPQDHPETLEPIKATSQLLDFLRIYWGWLLSLNQRQGREVMGVRFNVRIEDAMTASTVIDELLQTDDPFEALQHSKLKELNEEKRKASYRSKDNKDKYEAIRVLSNHPWLKGEMCNIYAALDQLPADEMITRFLQFAGVIPDAGGSAPDGRLNDDDRVKALVAHGSSGAHPGSSDYCFFGVENHWDFLWATSRKESASTAEALTEILLHQPAKTFDKTQFGYYILNYSTFHRVSNENYFYKYPNSSLKYDAIRISRRPMAAYICCPFAWTVYELSEGDTRQRLGLEYWSRYEHGCLTIKTLGIKMECIDEGWLLRTADEDSGIGLSLLPPRFQIGSDGLTDTKQRFNFQGFTILNNEGDDHIQTGVGFVKALVEEITTDNE